MATDRFAAPAVTMDCAESSTKGFDCKTARNRTVLIACEGGVEVGGFTGRLKLMVPPGGKLTEAGTLPASTQDWVALAASRNVAAALPLLYTRNVKVVV